MHLGVMGLGELRTHKLRDASRGAAPARAVLSVQEVHLGGGRGAAEGRINVGGARPVPHQVAEVVRTGLDMDGGPFVRSLEVIGGGEPHSVQGAALQDDAALLAPKI